MKFRTEYKPENSEGIFSPLKPVVLAGSCFSDNIAQKMRESLWNAINPFGVLYNPLSLANVLKLCLLSKSPEKDFTESLFFDGMKWRSWLFDSNYSSENRDGAIEAFLKTLSLTKNTLLKGRTIFITFGTAWVYLLKEKEGVIVSNCHKQPASLFERRRLSLKDITKEWDKLIAELKKKYPDLNILFTVSPVRHLKDGFEGNARSKAILLLAVEEICRNNENCFYFPAYEILNDDLRDYRFYASDLVHPSESAIVYIWDIFKKSFLSDSDLTLLSEGERIMKGLSHKPLPDATTHPTGLTLLAEQKRLDSLRSALQSLIQINPNALSPL